LRHQTTNSYRDSKLMVKDIAENQEYLKKRQEELEQIKKVSSQIKEMTVHMRTEVQKQGEQLTTIETHVIEAHDNAKKAEVEIQTAEKETRKSGRCLCWIAF